MNMMNKIIIFTLGAAAGSLVTWKIVETKYKKIADEEIESVVERFKERFEKLEDACNDNVEEVEPEVSEEITDEEKEKYQEVVSLYADGDKVLEETREFIKPYIISPEEFGEFGNDTKSLTYYADFVLVDEDDQIISDPESIIGDALEHFGEYEDDSVHVRDENIECDYEILKSEKTFSEINEEDD